MTWRDEVWAIVCREWQVGDVFTTDDLYRFERELNKKYPSNKHVRQKIQQQMQVLRDEHRILFIDNQGTYKRRR